MYLLVLKRTPHTALCVCEPLQRLQSYPFSITNFFPLSLATILAFEWKTSVYFYDLLQIFFVFFFFVFRFLFFVSCFLFFLHCHASQSCKQFFIHRVNSNKSHNNDSVGSDSDRCSEIIGNSNQMGKKEKSYSNFMRHKTNLSRASSHKYENTGKTKSTKTMKTQQTQQIQALTHAYIQTTNG